MHFAAVIASLSFLGCAFAQGNSTNSTVVTIQVGSTADAPGGIFQFIPPTVNATNGTVVNFRFTGMPGNHSITQSTFMNPCSPMDGGFDSGWVFLPSTNLTPVPEWNLTITDDSRPIWFFCKQLIPAPHCIAGMVGAINAPTSGNTFENFRSQASHASGVNQSQNGLVGIGASASARPQPLPSGASEFPVSGAPSPTGSAPASASSTSAATGLAVQSGVLAIVASVIGVFFA